MMTASGLCSTTHDSLCIEAWVRRYLTDAPHKVTEGVFTYVAINAQRQPRPSNTWGWHRDDHPDWA